MLNRSRSSRAFSQRLGARLCTTVLAGCSLAAVSLAVVSVAAVSVAVAWPAAAQDNSRSNAESRPPGFKLLLDRVTHRGREVVGLYGLVSEPTQPGMWRVKVWEELDDRVTVATDKIGCSLTSPLRITGTSRRLVIRELNPGGVITPRQSPRPPDVVGRVRPGPGRQGPRQPWPPGSPARLQRPVA